MIITLMGPTATQKTDLALALAEVFPIEIVSVDSALVYNGMDIGTAKPTRAMLAKVPHHLIDISSPEVNYSVAHFLSDAEKAIEAIQSRGKFALLVGGTMLYFKAFIEGLADIPPVPAEVRRYFKQKLDSEGIESLYRALSLVDPTIAARLHPNDTQRVLRALEVYEATQRPLSDWIRASIEIKPSKKLCQISLIPENRAQLHDILEKRFYGMLQQGFVEEVQQLKENYHLSLDMSSMRCIGYRQIWGYLAGEFSYKAMLEKGVAASRQLAKRQMTWLRSWPEHYRVAAYQKDTFTRLKEIIHNATSHYSYS